MNMKRENREQVTKNRDLEERFEFRSIHAEETKQAVSIEQVCFPPNEACSPEHMADRIAKVPELFLVAVDRSTGKIAGFLNGIATNECTFSDDFFINADLHVPDGDNVMLLGLDVLPEYRNQGLAREIMNQYIRREQTNKRKCLILTCLDSKVEMYKKMGFKDKGISASVWGGEEWHEMSREIE